MINRFEFPNTIFCLVGDNPAGLEVFDSESIVRFPASNETLYCVNSTQRQMFMLTQHLQIYSSNTVMEAQLEGCPVVAFNSGGVSELIELTPYGFMTESRTASGLSQSINKVLKMDFEREKISESAKRAFANDESVKKYIEVYNGALNELAFIFSLQIKILKRIKCSHLFSFLF